MGKWPQGLCQDSLDAWFLLEWHYIICVGLPGVGFPNPGPGYRGGFWETPELYEESLPFHLSMTAPCSTPFDSSHVLVSQPFALLLGCAYVIGART